MPTTLTILDRFGTKTVRTFGGDQAEFTAATPDAAWAAFRAEYGDYRLIGDDRVTLTRATSVEFRFRITEG